MSKNRCRPSKESKILLAAPAGPSLLQLVPIALPCPIPKNRTFRGRTSQILDLERTTVAVVYIPTAVPKAYRYHKTEPLEPAMKEIAMRPLVCLFPVISLPTGRCDLIAYLPMASARRI